MPVGVLAPFLVMRLIEDPPWAKRLKGAVANFDYVGVSLLVLGVGSLQVLLPLYYRLLRAFMRGSYEGSLNAPWLKIADTDCIRQVAESVVKSAAKDGRCVIVGRGSAY